MTKTETRYARGLATVTIVNPTELTWLEVISLGNHLDRVDLALIKHDTFDGEVDGIADLQAVVIEGEGSIGAIDAANANFVSSSLERSGSMPVGTIVKRALSIGDITPSEGDDTGSADQWRLAGPCQRGRGRNGDWRDLDRRR